MKQTLFFCQKLYKLNLKFKVTNLDPLTMSPRRTPGKMYINDLNIIKELSQIFN